MTGSVAECVRGLQMQNPAIDLTGAKILIVDDVPANLDVIYKSLRSESYQVLAAINGKTALEVVAQEHPDLILLDVLMPDLDGYEVCRRLKADPELQDIPIIFISAQDESDGASRAFQVGGSDYITKPIQREELLTRIRLHLERLFLARALDERKSDP